MPVAIAIGPKTKTISRLEDVIEDLPREERDLVKRMYWVNTSIGKQRIPETMRAWAERQFSPASIEEIENQTIVRVRNRLTREEALFNELRANRPFTSPVCPDSVMEQVLRTDNCSFCTPEEKTPVDVTGRVYGKQALTASNIAKYDAHHGLVIPFSHNPLEFSADKMRDCLEVAVQWFRREYAISDDAACPYLMGNILWRSGASINHGHLQMTLSTGGNYPVVEMQKSAGDAYSDCGRNGQNYFDDLFRAHEALGLGFFKHGSRIMAELTPKKEKGVMIIRWMPDWNQFPDIADSVDFVIHKYLWMDVQSFNLSFYLPSLPRDNGWSRFPNIVRLVDRGGLDKNTSDVGGMELAGIPVISTDPYNLMTALTGNN